MRRDAQKLSRKFIAYTPGQSYLVINTTYNRFFLYRNNKLIREGFCSTGSYTRLTNSEGSRQWIFKTPKGRFWIQQKITSPLWIRPDWSFVEEGLPIPPENDESRYEYGVLGDYAMSLGDGYLIHGTLYKLLIPDLKFISFNQNEIEVLWKLKSKKSQLSEKQYFTFLVPWL
jgi:L,D-transpeptidase ErfK/SrfK